MEMVPLKTTARSSDTSAAQLRRQNLVPCNLYGNETANTTVTCVYNEIVKAYNKAGESTLIELEVGDRKVPVLFHELQFDPRSSRVTHVDFYAVNMKKEIEAHVKLRFTGEAPAVNALQGVLVTVVDHLTVKCLPADLPHDLEVPLGSLQAIHDQITVAAIVLPPNVKIEETPETVLATVQEQRKEEEVVAPTAAEGAAVAGAAPAEGAKPSEAASAEGAPKKEEKKDKK